MLLNHPDYGPHIIAWQDNGAVSRRAKWLATLMLGGSTTLLWLSGAPVMFAAIITTVFVVVLTWLWWRPEPSAISEARLTLPDCAASVSVWFSPGTRSGG